MTEIAPEEAMERLAKTIHMHVLAFTQWSMSNRQAEAVSGEILRHLNLTPADAASLMVGEAVVVPKNPTPEMFMAAWEALVPSGDARACWDSMIAAAQQKDQG